LGLPKDWNVLAHEVENYGEIHSLPENALALTEGDLTEGAVDGRCNGFATAKSVGCAGVEAWGALDLTEGGGGVPLFVVEDGLVEALKLNAAQTLLPNDFQAESVQAMSKNEINRRAEDGPLQDG